MAFKDSIKDIQHVSLQKEWFLNHYEKFEEYYGNGKTKRQKKIDNWHDYHRRKWSRIRKIRKRRKK